MHKKNIQSDRGLSNRNLRRGAVAVYFAVCGAVVIGFAALAVDVGMLYATQAEMQRCADAAAMAATWELLDEDRLLSDQIAEALEIEAREMAAYAAGENSVHRDAPLVNQNQDVDVGYVSDLTYTDNIVFSSAAASNAIRVRVQRDSQHGGSISLYFARFLGADSKDLMADAVAAFEDGVVGYEVTSRSGNAELLPFTLHIDSWNGLLSGAVTTGDNYTYDPDTGAVYPGPDGILELNLYPGAGADQLTPGNFGTVDIGSSNNSTADIARQILYGVNESDLAYFGGQLRLNDCGYLMLNGDTGLSAGIKDELEDIKGQPRAIPIFSQVSGPGNNAMYQIIQFAGIRIMNVKLTGKMTKKEVIIQPAIVVDDAVIAEAGPGPSDYVYSPVRLIN